MTFHFFTVPALDSAVAEQDLNAFCKKHRVVGVDRQWIADGPQSYWALCLTVAEGDGRLPAELRAGRHHGRPKVDYKERLDPAAFTVFAKLREWRKRAALANGVPVYSVFTNEQLAAIVQLPALSLEELAQIPGIGESRLRRFGHAIIAEVEALASSASAIANGPNKS